MQIRLRLIFLIVCACLLPEVIYSTQTVFSYHAPHLANEPYRGLEQPKMVSTSRTVYKSVGYNYVKSSSAGGYNGSMKLRQTAGAKMTSSAATGSYAMGYSAAVSAISNGGSQTVAAMSSIIAGGSVKNRSGYASVAYDQKSPMVRRVTPFLGDGGAYENWLNYMAERFGTDFYDLGTNGTVYFYTEANLKKYFEDYYQDYDDADPDDTWEDFFDWFDGEDGYRMSDKWYHRLPIGDSIFPMIFMAIAYIIFRCFKQNKIRTI